MGTMPLRIGPLAGDRINLVTVRYYDRQGLLPKRPRSRLGFRLYPMDAARQLRFIKHAQELGFALQEMRELLALRISLRTSSAVIRKPATTKTRDIESKIKIPGRNTRRNRGAALQELRLKLILV